MLTVIGNYQNTQRKMMNIDNFNKFNVFVDIHNLYECSNKILFISARYLLLI